MRVPFLDLKIQYQSIKTEITAAIQDILENSTFILGKPVSEFENEFASIHSVKNCIGLSSGTDGNHAVLWALGLNQDDEVLMPVNTFIATAWGVVLNRAKPVFVDCDSESYNLNPYLLEQAINSKTKAIIAVHLYGQPADMDTIKDIAHRHGLHLVEDCAQAHLAEYKGKRVGGLSEAASFSFYPGKNLGAYGEAGAVTTNNDDLARIIRMIRDHGSLEKYDHKIYGHNYRMETIQAAVLNVKLNHIAAWTERRREIAALYKELLKDLEDIKLPVEMPYAKHVYHLFVVQIRSRVAGQREKLVKYLDEKGVSTGLHYPIPLHLQTCFNHLNYEKGDFPVSEDLADYGLSLPVFPEMTTQQIEYVCEKIKTFFKSEKQNNISRVEISSDY